MKNARLTQSYDLGVHPVTGVGLSVPQQAKLDTALEAKVPAIVFDDAGTEEITAKWTMPIQNWKAALNRFS